jgi:hypothetical protein
MITLDYPYFEHLCGLLVCSDVRLLLINQNFIFLV